MRHYILLVISAIAVCGCAHRFEMAGHYEGYAESYKNDTHARLRGVGGAFTPNTSVTPNDNERMEITGTGGYLGVAVKTDQKWIGRGGLSYTKFAQKKYDVVAGGNNYDVTLDTYSAALELAAGYQILDTTILAIRPEIVIKEQAYYMDVRVKDNPALFNDDSLISHEYLGAALNLEFPFILGRLGIRGSAYWAFHDNVELNDAYAYSVTASIIFGSFKGGKGGGGGSSGGGKKR